VADPIHYQAVAETSGLYLTYNATLTYGFYVAGDSAVQGPGCVGAAGATEQWVTYNEGRTSTDVEQTALGFVHAPGDVGYGQNRGCMGQWSARCLENENAYDYRAILRFFYGDDVEVIQAPGACVDENVDASGDSSGMTTAADGTSADLDGGSDSATSGLETSAGTSAGTSGMGTRGPGEADDGEPESGGTGASSAALPGTYGVNESDQAGCACQSRPGGTSWLLGLLAVFIGGPRVPRTKKPRAPERIG
jgi:MYXO-CTERM domain-containing protein